MENKPHQTSTFESRKAVIILGMHRSGTSTLSRLLIERGVKMGDNLLPGDFTNPEGHFEDEDYLNFHKEILKHFGENAYSNKQLNFVKLKRFEKEAIELSHEKSSHSLWGWKDPRTVIVLPLWKKILPNAKFICVFRSWSDNVKSLLKREIRILDHGASTIIHGYFGRQKFKKEIDGKANEFLRSWIFTNSVILNLIKESSENILLPFDKIDQWPIEINRTLKLSDRHLENYKSTDGILSKNVYSRKVSLPDITWDDELVAQAEEIQKELFNKSSV